MTFTQRLKEQLRNQQNNQNNQNNEGSGGNGSGNQANPMNKSLLIGGAVIAGIALVYFATKKKK